MSLHKPSMARSYKPTYPCAHASIFVVGPSGVGKSTFVRNILGEPSGPDYTSTLDVCSFEKTIEFDGSYVYLAITDIAAPTTIPLRTIVHSGTPNTCIILMYDVTSESSWAKVEASWLDLLEWKRRTSISLKPSSVILLGNKRDLNDRRITFSESATFATLNGFAAFLESSAKDCENVNEVLTCALNLCMKSEESSYSMPHIRDYLRGDRMLWADRTRHQGTYNTQGVDQWNKVSAGSHFSVESDEESPQSLFRKIIQKCTGKLGCFGEGR